MSLIHTKYIHVIGSRTKKFPHINFYFYYKNAVILDVCYFRIYEYQNDIL